MEPRPSFRPLVPLVGPLLAAWALAAALILAQLV